MQRVRRAHALAALAVTALTLTTACTATNAQTTTLKYDPADGQDADLGRVHVDSLLVVSQAGTEGPGNVVARLTNAGSTDASITIAGPGGLDDTFEVGAQDAVSIGPDGDRSATITEVGAEPGGLVDLTLSDADGTRKTITVPVVTGTQPEFATLVPTPTPTPTPTPSPSERSATPSRSGTATSSSSIRPSSSSAPSSSSSSSSSD